MGGGVGCVFFFFFQAEDGIRDWSVTGVQTCALPIFSFGGTEEPGAHRDSCMGPEVYYSSLGTSGFLQLLVSLGCLCRHLEYDQYPELHTYLVVQKL